MRYPDFLCIGAQKAGTSWLHSRLMLHSQLWLPPSKELHYFKNPHMPRNERQASRNRSESTTRMKAVLDAIHSKARNNKMPRGAQLRSADMTSLAAMTEMNDQWYGRIFALAGDAAVCGEIAPEYALLSDAAIEHIVRLNPDIKIIFLMRDPIERGWSGIRMQLKEAGQRNRTPKSIEAMVALNVFFARGDYMTTIGNFRRFVDADRFLPLYYDDIADRPREMLRTVHDFLGVDDSKTNEENLDAVRNKGPSEAMDDASYNAMRARLRPAYEKLLSLNNPIVARWYRKHFESRP
jgi:Sulfotransferase family